MNFNEQLVREWYDFQGYLVKTNLHFRGQGRKFELDVLAYNPRDHSVVHVEVGADAASKDDIEAKIRSKMSLERDDYERIMNCQLTRIIKRAIYGWSKRPRLSTLIRLKQDDVVEVVALNDFIREILPTLDQINSQEKTVHESWPLLKAMSWARYTGNLASVRKDR